MKLKIAFLVLAATVMATPLPPMFDRAWNYIFGAADISTDGSTKVLRDSVTQLMGTAYACGVAAAVPTGPVDPNAWTPIPLVELSPVCATVRGMIGVKP
jgi:hypothetical protein